jgi:hypothetical protein
MCAPCLKRFRILVAEETVWCPKIPLMLHRQKIPTLISVFGLYFEVSLSTLFTHYGLPHQKHLRFVQLNIMYLTSQIRLVS